MIERVVLEMMTLTTIKMNLFYLHECLAVEDFEDSFFAFKIVLGQYPEIEDTD